MARRVRRTRVGKNFMKEVNTLVERIKADAITMEAVANGDNRKSYGRALNIVKLDDSNESAKERYIDSDAKRIAGFAINIVRKGYRESNIGAIKIK